MKRVVFIFCILFIPGFAWEVSCLNEAPEWMQKQISNQIGECAVDTKDIHKSYERIKNGFYGEFAPVAIVSFSEGKCQWEMPEKCNSIHTKKAKAFAHAIEELHIVQPLPAFTLLLSLDACFERPYHLHLSNVPVFSVSKSKHNKRVLLLPRGVFEPERETMHLQITEHRKPLEEREEKVLWRLQTFDRAEIEYNWRISPVLPLLFLAKKNSDRLDFGIPKHCQRFVGSKVSGHLRGLYKPGLLAKEKTNYRYQLAFDYRSSPPDLEEQLFSGAVIFRAKTKFSEWFTENLEPYQHYIPIDERCEQIFDAMEWCKNNPEQINQIALKAQNFADHQLNDQQMFTYLHKLICSYAEKLGGSND